VTGERPLVFVPSWSDFFHNEADPWRDEAWKMIRETPALTYQILTKRPGRILHYLPEDWGDGYPNVWMGVSVENKEWLRRIEVLRRVPAVVRFVSFEPLLENLGPVDLSGIHWAIIGGESGPQRRPMDLRWMLLLYEHCKAQGVPVFIKQDSGVYEGRQGQIPDWLWKVKEFPRGIQSPRLKKTA
jgi:protein gp37